MSFRLGGLILGGFTLGCGGRCRLVGFRYCFPYGVGHQFRHCSKRVVQLLQHCGWRVARVLRRICGHRRRVCRRGRRVCRRGRGVCRRLRRWCRFLRWLCVRRVGHLLSRFPILILVGGNTLNPQGPFSQVERDSANVERILTCVNPVQVSQRMSFLLRTQW